MIFSLLNNLHTRSIMATPAVPTKRKRTQVVSYAEPAEDDLFDQAEGLDDEEGAIRDAEDELSDGDTEFGSRKKPRKAKKRVKLTHSRTKKAQKPFPFLALPAELRDYIYELALTDEGGLALVSKTKGFRRTITRGFVRRDSGTYEPFKAFFAAWKCQSEIIADCLALLSIVSHYYGNSGIVGNSEDEHTNRSLVPNLLAVNKQINSEGVGYLYKQPLILEDTMALHTFLAAIGPSNRLQVTDLTVKGWGMGRGTNKAMNVAALTSLAGCTNLQSFNLDCRVGWMRRPIRLAQQLFRDGHYFFEAYGAANGRKDAAVDILQLNDWNYDRSNYYGWLRVAGSLPDSEKFKEEFQAELRKVLMK